MSKERKPMTGNEENESEMPKKSTSDSETTTTPAEQKMLANKGSGGIGESLDEDSKKQLTTLSEVVSDSMNYADFSLNELNTQLESLNESAKSLEKRDDETEELITTMPHHQRVETVEKASLLGRSIADVLNAKANILKGAADVISAVKS